MARSTKSRRARGLRRKAYTRAEHEAAVGEVAKLGLTSAAVRHGMPVSTLCKWSKAKEAAAAVKSAGASLVASAAVAVAGRRQAGAAEGGAAAGEALHAESAGADPRDGSPGRAERGIREARLQPLRDLRLEQ